MKKFLLDFIYNPFWRALPAVVPLVLSVIVNGILWYIYATKIKQNPMPFIFSSGIIGLNLILANELWNREKLSSELLVLVALFTQLLMLVFIRYLTLSF